MRLLSGFSLVAGVTSEGILTDEYDCNCYLWEYTAGEFALFDSGSGRNIPALLQSIQANGGAVERIRSIFLTHHHADHSGGAAELRTLSGARVVASRYSGEIISTGDEERMGLRAARSAGGYPADYRIQACPIDTLAEDGDVFVLGEQRLTVLATPGHCSGALSFLVECNGQTGLISGDVIFEGGTISLLLLPDCSLFDYHETMTRLAHLSIDFLLPGHGDAQLSGASECILMAHRQFQRLLIPPCYYHNG